ncbi:MAG: periplasmic heavy metal sensor, partial [Verrucomicrobiales bacterium]|nr:periplasmic heavy metal sensor [Verrucomicrobiales bacterium]
MQQSERPELAWLKEEFNLSEAEFKRVSELHEAYLPQCREMCIQIDAQNTKLQKLLARATNISPEIERELGESSRLRTECQTMMLRQFFQVSQTMPPEQGRRYLSWVKERGPSLRNRFARTAAATIPSRAVEVTELKR